MNYKVEVIISDYARTDINKIKDRNIQKKIIKKLEMLEKHPELGEKLTGDLSKLYKARADDYRIIYDKKTDHESKIIRMNITVIMFEDRKKVYKAKTIKQILKRFEQIQNNLD